jgi:hypothetical protein
VVLIAGGLLFYSQTWAFAWDEGFHLLAAQLIKAGRRPYIDFCFPQTPLNAYWNAGWMAVFGESWRTAHALAALATAGAIWLSADFLRRRFPVTRWRFAVAVAGAILIGLNAMVFEYGTVGQAYGLCLFLTVAAFRLAILVPERPGWLFPASAGFLASSAAGSSLLTATVAPVLSIWILIYHQKGRRWTKFTAFAAGAAIAWLPMLWLFAEAPKPVWFGIVQYNALYRSVDWPDATRHNLEVLTYWIDSSQALSLSLLAAFGVFFIANSGWERGRRAEFYLCGWLAMAIAAELCIPHPTFQRYFLLVVPFLAILAACGLYAITVRMFNQDRPLWPVLVLTVLISLGLAKSLYERGTVYSWPDLEKIARKVDEVTPAQGLLYADEHIYFLTKRRPPSGLELADSHRLELLPAEFAASVHVVPKSELNRRVAAGKFMTVATFDDADDIDAVGLPRLYAQRAQVGDCTVFWDRRQEGRDTAGQNN